MAEGALEGIVGAAGQTLRALRHRNFRLFFFGQLFSLIGTWMQNTAQGWLMWRLTGSEWMLGLVGFAQLGPVFFLGLFGGLAADRFPRHRIVITTQAAMLVQATSLAALTLSGVVTPWEIVALAALLGTINAFDMPGRQAFLVQMVGREDLGNAIALNSSIFNGARVVGPAVAGFAVAYWGEGACFAFNALSYLAVLASLLLMKIESLPPAAVNRGAMESLREGFAYAFRTPHVRSLLSLVAATSFFGLPFSFFLPAIAGGTFKKGPSGLGELMACLGLGALSGALFMAYRTGTGSLGRLAGLFSLTFGALLVAFSQSRSFALSCALLTACGFCMMAQMAATNTCLQSFVPDPLRGRLMSLYVITFVGLAPLGGLLQGRLAGVSSVQAVVLAGGVITSAAAAVFLLRPAPSRPAEGTPACG
jgi:MFS family permease